jgi:drug/metabolite transporter (DMT)-like permease
LGKHPQFKAYAALAAVCFFWGTTYLGIRIALESFSPVVLVCGRFLISGALTLLAAKAMGLKIPGTREMWRTSLNGIIILGIGNSCLSFAEQWIPSGVAALFITTSPFWMVGVEALVPGGEPLHAPAIGGMLLGFAGVAFMVMRNGLSGVSGPMLTGFLTLQIGCAGWALGSISQRRQTARAHPIVSGGIQQLATGVVFLIPALLFRTHPIVWSARGLWAVAYLVTFGSIVGYSAYIYALSHLPVAVVSIYTYINPLVAVCLGWVFFREAFGAREAIAMLVIFAGVAIVKRATPAKSSLQAADPVLPSASRPADRRSLVIPRRK